jgi:hypothetical protein
MNDAATIIRDHQAPSWYASSMRASQRLALRLPALSFGYTSASLRALLADASGRFSFDDRTPGECLPCWYGAASRVGYQSLSGESLWLVDALARYEGEVLIAQDPLRLRWGVHEVGADGVLSQMPAVVGYRWPFRPIDDIALFAVRAAGGAPEDPQHVVAGLSCYCAICRCRP